jgi:large subunit ribosomal protein L16
MPKKTKYRKAQRGRRKGKALTGNTVAFGEYGLQSLMAAWINERQIEAARRAMTHFMKRGGKIWIRIFPDKPYSARPAETRMGGGKGAPVHFVATVRPGTMMFELAGVTHEEAVEAMRLAAHKLPVRTRFVSKEAVSA